MDQQQEYREKAADYCRFSYIILILTGFLFLGYVIPSEQQYSPVILAGILLGIFFSFLFNKKYLHYKKLTEEE